MCLFDVRDADGVLCTNLGEGALQGVPTSPEIKLLVCRVMGRENEKMQTRTAVDRVVQCRGGTEKMLTGSGQGEGRENGERKCHVQQVDKVEE